MKTANVVHVRDKGPLAASQPLMSEPDEDRRIDRIADLFRLYPHIAEAEKAGLLDFLKNGRQLDIGLASAREGVAARMMQFRKDHARDFRLKPHQMLGFTALVLGPLIALAWACFG
ncbi:hypothetical protein [Sphingosinicella terrae]|uniref:hypothetical protein n=1 Tax=Sphingosinicella terrae TaxID=2172047 RepID=UPI000E0E087B|nr:hypothetical protein [Sphingosinicella terrae]